MILLNLLFYKGDFLEYFDYKSYDILNLLDQKDEPNDSVVVVDIDEKSLDAFGQWPWSRLILAHLLDKINSAHPASIGVDIIFAEQDKTSPIVFKRFYNDFFSYKLKLDGLPKELEDNDKIFAQALKNSRVSLAVFINDKYKKKVPCKVNVNGLIVKDDSFITYKTDSLLCNVSQLQNAVKNVGFINSSVDKDGVFRRLPLFAKYDDQIIPALSISTLINVDNIVLNGNFLEFIGQKIRMGQNSEVLLSFSKKNIFKTVSVLDVLAGRVKDEIFRGKFVLIGTTATGLHDRFIASSGELLAGVYVHATLIDNLLKNELRFEYPHSKEINFILANFLLLALLYLMFIKRHVEVVFSFLAIVFIFLIVSYLYFLKGVFISPAHFVVTLGIGFFVINISSVILSYFERRKFYNEISKAHTSTIDSMALVVESRDTETGAHIKRTKEFVKILCEHLQNSGKYKKILKKEFIELVYRASPLHDLGKVAIPDKILKKPGRLTPEEFEIMKEHAKLGKDILESALNEHGDNKFLKIARNIAYYHHEKWDGSGYPQGLKGEKIPLEGRLMAIADVYDAITSKRVYKESFSFEKAEKIIIDGKGTHFDPLLVEAFEELKDEFRKIAIKIQED